MVFVILGISRLILSFVYHVCMFCRAFDLVVHIKLLMKLLEASMPAIVVRLMVVMFLTQFANVRWCGALSDIFFLKMAASKGLGGGNISGIAGLF